MQSPLKNYSTRQTSQLEPIPGKDQVQNSAGGYSFAVDDWQRLRRFLILGTEGGSYYANENKLTRENADVVFRCVKEDGPRTVEIIADVSMAGRAKNNDQAIFALAVACASDDLVTRLLARDSLSLVCRTGTHLFHFAEFVQQFRGWGRGLRRGIANWYLKMPVDKLALQLVKYRQRDGWSHRDLLRLAHPKTSDPVRQTLFDFACGRETQNEPEIVTAFNVAQSRISDAELAVLIRDANLPREAIKPDDLNSVLVWDALLYRMPITALVRNLPTLTRHGVIKPLGGRTSEVVQKLTDQEVLTKGRVHPIQLLMAQVAYAQGIGRGGREWTPAGPIVDALEQAFYLSFGSITPANKRTLLALDVSGSMTGGEVAGSFLTPREAAAAMALVTVTTEPETHVMAFSRQFVPIQISAKTSLREAIELTSGLPFSGTDCALPMLYALKNNLEVDTFIVYTDSETWAGNIHPTQAIQEYRRKTGIDARLIVVGMVSNGFSIADPNDAGMLDVVGFDTATPELMSAFSRGEL